MSWYNGGVWDGLDGTTIPNVLAELCNALNERREALGLSRTAWSVNTGTEASPTLGTKSTALAASDFYGLEIDRHDVLSTVYSQALDLIAPSGGYNSTTQHSGWAKTGTNTGLGSDLWTGASILADAGLTDATYENGFDSRRANFLREAFDRMLYPVVYPTLDITQRDLDSGLGTRTYHYEGVDGSNSPCVAGTAAGAWADLAQSSFNSNLPFELDINVLPGPLLCDSTEWFYSAEAHPMRCGHVIVPRYTYPGGTPTVTGYPGSVSRLWVGLNVTAADVISRDVDALGATFTVTGSYSATTLNEIGSIGAVDLASGNAVEIKFPTFPGSLPFDGHATHASRVDRDGFGSIRCILFAKTNLGSGGIVTTRTGLDHTRVIIDMSAEFSDQV